MSASSSSSLHRLQRVFESSWPPGVVGLRRLLGAAVATARVEVRTADKAQALAGAAVEGVQCDLQVDDVPEVLRDVNLLLPGREMQAVVPMSSSFSSSLPVIEGNLVLSSSYTVRGRSHRVPPPGPLSAGG